jgi:hypothetical protein
MTLTTSTGMACNRARGFALLLLVCSLVLALGPAAQVQSEPDRGSDGGCFLMVPSLLLGRILALNSQGNVNVINTVQIGNDNFVLIQVKQGSLAVPANAVSGLVQVNINVINIVQIGNNNVAIIGGVQGGIAEVQAPGEERSTDGSTPAEDEGSGDEDTPNESDCDA